MNEYREQFWLKTDQQSGTQFVISTKISLLDKSFIQTSFQSEHMSWAKQLSSQGMDTMLNNSLTYGLYLYTPPSAQKTLGEDTVALVPRDQLRQIGMGRTVTDYVTFAWITDVFVLPEHQGVGLGKWLVQCIGENMEAIHQGGALRRAMLMTSKTTDRIGFYNKLLGMNVHPQDGSGPIVMVTSSAW